MEIHNIMLPVRYQLPQKSWKFHETIHVENKDFPFPRSVGLATTGELLSPQTCEVRDRFTNSPKCNWVVQRNTKNWNKQTNWKSKFRKNWIVPIGQFNVYTQAQPIKSTVFSYLNCVTQLLTGSAVLNSGMRGRNARNEMGREIGTIFSWKANYCCTVNLDSDCCETSQQIRKKKHIAFKR